MTKKTKKSSTTKNSHPIWFAHHLWKSKVLNTISQTSAHLNQK